MLLSIAQIITVVYIIGLVVSLIVAVLFWFTQLQDAQDDLDDPPLWLLLLLAVIWFVPAGIIIGKKYPKLFTNVLR